MRKVDGVSMDDTVTFAAVADDLIGRLVNAGSDMRAAANAVTRRYPKITLGALEEIGSWPSSEPRLAALQRAFGR